MTRLKTSSTGSVFIARVRRLFRADREEGGALVELGLTLPIICLIMTGIFAVSIAIYQKLALAEGISAGARTLAADRGNTQTNGTYDPCTDAVKAVYAAAPTLTQSSLTFSFVIGGVTTNGTSCSGTVLSSNGETAQVQATYPCSIKMYGFKLPSCTLSYAVTEEVQ